MSNEHDKIKILIHKIGLKYNLRDDEIRKIISSPYKFTRKKITELNFQNVENEEDFNNIKTNFIFPNIGKLYTNYKIFQLRNKQKNKNNE